MRTRTLELSHYDGNAHAPAPPALSGYGGNLQQFVKDTENHFGRDVSGLYLHAASRPITEQKALFNHSKRLQDFLGIREHSNPAQLVHQSPLRFRETAVSSGSTQRFLYRPQSDVDDPLALNIHYSAAPAALAKAVTLLTDDAMIGQSLARLEAVLQENPLSRAARYWDGPEYRKSIGVACSVLLESLGDLKNESHQRKVLDLCVPLYAQLDPSAQADIRLAARKALSRSGVSETLRTDLEHLATGAMEAKPQDADSAAESGKAKDVSSDNEITEIAGTGYSPIVLENWPSYKPQFKPLVLCTQYARQAAERLIGDDGKLDQTQIPRMLEELRKETQLNEDYQQYAIRTLEKLGSSEQIKSTIDSVCEHSLLKRDAADLIRATLQMPHDAPVTEVEARKAVVMGLLGYLRQDETGTCFAASVSVCLLDNLQEQVASEMKQLLETQKLQFRANDAVVEVPLNMKINRADTQTPYRMDEVEESNETATYEYLGGPAMQAALNTFGIPEQDRKSVVNNAVKKLREAGVDPESFSPQALIEQIMNDVLDADSSKRAVTAALNAFTMTEMVGLTNAWAMTLASGADILRNGQHRLSGKIVFGPPIAGRPELQPLASVMQRYEKSLQSAGESEQARVHAIAQEMLNGINAQMQKRFCVQYDPSFKISDDPGMMRGAFILYSRTPADDPSKWQRIDNPATYQAAVVGLIESAYVDVHERLVGPDVNPRDRNANETAHRQLTHTLVEYVRKDEFLRYVIGQMNPSARDMDMPFENYKELPWKQLRGSTSSVLGESYGAKRFYSPNFDETLGPVPKTKLRDLAPGLNFLLDSLKKMRPELQAKAASSHPDFKIVVAAGNHAFTLMPMRMKEAWEDENSSAERWIEEKLKNPVMQYWSEKRTSPALISLVTEAANTLGVRPVDIYTKVVEKGQTTFRDGAQPYTLKDLYEVLEACECPYKNRDQLLASVEAQLTKKISPPPPIIIGDYIWADEENGNTHYLQVRYDPFKDRVVGEVRAKDGSGFDITGAQLGEDWELSTPFELPAEKK